MPLKDRARAVRRDTYALYRCARDPRVGWPARAVGVVVLAYALSPIDLIPDFLPVIGYVDDAVVIPAGLILFRRMVPTAVFEEHRRAAEGVLAKGGRASVVAAAVIVLTWVALAALIALAILA